MFARACPLFAAVSSPGWSLSPRDERRDLPRTVTIVILLASLGGRRLPLIKGCALCEAFVTNASKKTRSGRPFATPSRGRRYFSNLISGFSDPSPRDSEEEEGTMEDIERWERMWEEGELNRNIMKALDPSPASYTTTTTTTRSEVRVISFDLDNTLWRTGEVISHANNVLADYLEEKRLIVPVRTEIVMGELFKKDMKKYCPLEQFDEDDVISPKEEDDGTTNNVRTDFDKAAGGESSAVAVNNKQKGVHIASGTAKPVLLTQLRTDALKDIFIRYNSYSPEKAQEAAEDAFQIWTKARHDAIPNHMANGVLESLEELRNIKSQGSGQGVVIGAITDGNSDPRTVSQLKPYFDFVINSENIGVAKPDARVYLAAVEELLYHPNLEDVFIDVARQYKMLGDIDDDVEESRMELLENAISDWWVHIGDDFMKDVVAARDLGMRTIWCRELVKKHSEAKSSSEEEREESAPEKVNGGAGTTGDKKKTKRDVADLMKELASMKVVEMSIGSSEFLADSIHREFANEIVDEFSLIGPILRAWNMDCTSCLEDGLVSDTISDIAPPPESTKSTTDPELPPPDGPPPAADTKFCVNCGTKLPFTANFCSSCGERQPPSNYS